MKVKEAIEYFKTLGEETEICPDCYSLIGEGGYCINSMCLNDESYKED